MVLVLQFVLFQSCFGYSRSFAIPCEFYNKVYISFFFFFNFYLLFIYYVYPWLCWAPISLWGLSPVAASGGHSSSRCAGLSPSRPLLLRSRGSRRSGSAAVAHGPSRSAACGILPDQGPNPCPLHWQADPQPLCHQGSPGCTFLLKKKKPAGIWEYVKSLNLRKIDILTICCQFCLIFHMMNKVYLFI